MAISRQGGQRVHFTATQHSGQETTITSFHTTLLHQGMIIVDVPYSYQEIMKMSETISIRPGSENSSLL